MIELWVVSFGLFQTSVIASVSSKGFLDIQTTIECGFTLKHVCDIMTTYNQIYRTDKYSQHSCWVFGYKLSGYGFKPVVVNAIFIFAYDTE